MAESVLNLYRGDANERRCYKRPAAAPAETVLFLVRKLHEQARDAELVAACELAAYRARDSVLSGRGVPRTFVFGGSRDDEIRRREEAHAAALADLRHAEECLALAETLGVRPDAVVKRGLTDE